MGRKMMLVNLNRCTGCWTCSMACKNINHYDDSEYWLTVRTLGNGAGIDKPQGQWPNLSMAWQPVWTMKCIDCGPRQAAGKKPFCVDCCPTRAISYGEEAEKQLKELQASGFEIFEMPVYENTRENVVYGRKEQSAFKD